MAATVTVTGTAGAGLTVTSAVFTGITSFTIDAVNNLITMVQGSVVLPAISINAATTVTATKAAAVWTLTIS
jgi:hypothetical protein